MSHVRSAAFILVGLMLSMMDAAFSLAERGRFVEANPLLAPLLPSPIAFVLVKTTLVVIGCFGLSRIEKWQLAAAPLFAYLVVNSYWIFRVTHR